MEPTIGAAQAIGLTQAQEEEQVLQLEETLQKLANIQRIFIRNVPKDQLTEAAGRRCILHVSGLKHVKKAFFFEVSGTDGVRIVPPYEGFTTVISAPLDAILRVLNGVLEGDSAAFSTEWSHGTVKIVGDHSVHDGWVFRETFGKLADIIRKYRGGR